MLATRALLSRSPAARPNLGPRGTVTLSSLGEAAHGFLRVEVLPQYLDQEGAREVLNRLRRDPAVVSVMKAHQWTVGALIELSPQEQTLLGYNQNK